MAPLREAQTQYSSQIRGGALRFSVGCRQQGFCFVVVSKLGLQKGADGVANLNPGRGVPAAIGTAVGATAQRVVRAMRRRSSAVIDAARHPLTPR